MKSYDSGGPMVSGHTTPQGGDRDKHGEDPQYHPAKPSGRVFAEWVRLPKVASMPEVTFMVEQSAPSATAAPGRWFLETFLKALDTHNGHGTPSLDRAEAYLLKAEARKLLASAQTETDTTAVLATQDGLTPLGQRIAALEAYEIILNQIAEVVGIETPYGALPDAVKDLAQRAEERRSGWRDVATDPPEAWTPEGMAPMFVLGWFPGMDFPRIEAANHVRWWANAEDPIPGAQWMPLPDGPHGE